MTLIPYNPKLKERARQLRKNMTLSEVLLWNRLKGGQMRGLDFDRQRPLDEFIVDFYCKRLKLAIEIDGASHDGKEEKDARRQKRLESYGVRFLRFRDDDVKRDVEGVVRRIENWVSENGG